MEGHGKYSRIQIRSYLPILGLGCVWAWAFTFARAALWFSSDASLQSNAFSLTLQLGQIALLFLLSFLGERLFSLKLRRGLIAASLFGCLIIFVMYLSFGFGIDFTSSTAFVVTEFSDMLFATGFGLVFGLTKACHLFSWAQCSYGQDKNTGTFSVACSFIIAGILFFVVDFKVLTYELAFILFPLIGSISFLLASLRESSDKKLALCNSVRLTHRELLLCVMAIAFVWGALPHDDMNFATVDTALGGLIAGTILAFLVRFLRDGVDLELALLFSILVIGVALLTALVFVGYNDFSATFACACFQVSFLIVLVNGSARGTSANTQAIAFICRDMAFFLVTIFLGLLFGLIFTETFWVLLMAFVLLSAILVFFFWRSRLSDAAAEEEYPLELIDVNAGNLIRQRCQAFANQYDLTGREYDVLVLLSQGHTLQHIASELVLSMNTVKKHRSSLYIKLGIHKRQELINLFSR